MSIRFLRNSSSPISAPIPVCLTATQGSPHQAPFKSGNVSEPSRLARYSGERLWIDEFDRSFCPP